MKRRALLALVALVTLGALCLAGCGSKTGVSLDTKDGKVKVDTGEGKVEVDTRAPSEAELGAPVYPGAKGSPTASGTVSDGGMTFSATTFITDASVAEVMAWYRDKLSGKPMFSETNAPSGGLISFQDGDEARMVTVSTGMAGNQKGKTVIVIGGGSGVPGLTD